MEEETLIEFLRFLRTKPHYMISYAKFEECLAYEFMKLKQSRSVGYCKDK